MKWTVLGGKDQEVRFRCLSDYLTTLGVPNELSFSNPEIDDIFLELERQTLAVDQIRLQSPYSDRAHEFQSRATDLVNLLGSSDAYVKNKEGKWWPENFLYEAFCSEFLKHVKQVDIGSHALIVGSGSGSKVVVAALIKMGFSKFYISDRFEDRAKTSIEKMKRHFFGIDFNFVPAANLMLLPGSSSVLVNGTPLVPDNNLLKDLYYFNFLKHPAVIIDLNLIPPEPPLIEEGRSIQAQVISGYEIAAKVDDLWAQKAFQVKFDVEVFKGILKEKLSAIPFDATPYKLS